MVDFRRGITALGMFALFTGLAAAQVGSTGQPLTCNTNVTVTPQLRGEGYTEQTGDIVISCTGGTPLAYGANVPLVNIVVSYNSTVTSRLLPATNAPNASEALLLIDEPGSGLGGFGPSLPQTLCSTPAQGCTAVVGTVAGNPVNTPVNPGTSTAAPNVYQGIVNANTVTFFGVPAMPPTTTGSRVYRITNVRVNANSLGGGSASGASPVQAFISTNGATSLPIQNSNPTVGFVSNGLSTSAGSGSLNQCSGQSKTSISVLTFSENFGTAFKTRVAAQPTQGDTLYQGQINNLTQNVPGGIYNSESNFVLPIGSQTAGLADFGTRLKATFNNIPNGVRVFVSVANVNNAALAVVKPTTVGGSVANANVAGSYTGYAQLVTSETVSDSNTGSGFFPSVSASDNGPGNNGTVPIAEVGISNGTGSAVWEVVNTNPNTNESFKFAVYVSYNPSVATNTPLPGGSTVNLSFAPTATSGVASSSLPIPRFTGDSSAARNILTINICRTILLYPYVTNQAGFDTGMTIANTSLDSYTTGNNTTGAQSGSCKLTYYGGTTAAPTTPPGPSDTGTIAAGTVWANTLQAIAPNFQGYVFAVCNFQFAHGFAFISDVGARNLAMGYLAVVLNDPGTDARSNKDTTTSENGAH